jgi:uncharacterized protein involved in response to NO
MILAYIAMLAAMAMRVGGVSWISSYSAAVVGSALLWALAYGIFVIRYLPILASPRPDGRPG